MKSKLLKIRCYERDKKGAMVWFDAEIDSRVMNAVMFGRFEEL